MLFDLIFEGGGVKGIAFVGALQALSEHGHRYGRLIGTSVGSLFATLLTAGYEPLELRERLWDAESGRLEFARVMQAVRPLSQEELAESGLARLLEEVDLPVVPDLLEGSVERRLLGAAAKRPGLNRLLRFLEEAGLYDDGPFLHWLGERLDAKTPAGAEKPYGAMTLEEFYQATQRSLTVIATDVTSATMLILNHNTAPHCPVVCAVRMSAGAPPLFAPVTWQPTWGRYSGSSLDGHQVVDGAFLSNFPIELFLSQESSVLRLMGQPTEGAHALGLLLDESRVVPGLPPAYVPAWRQRLGTLPGVTLLMQLLQTSIDARDKSIMEMYPGHVVHLPTQGIAFDQFELPAELGQMLVTAGHNAVVTFLTDGSLARMQEMSELAQRVADQRASHIITIYGNIMGDSIAIGAGASASVRTET